MHFSAQKVKISMRLAFYGRVSTANQEKEETIENQLLVVKEKFEKEGHVFVKDYIDEGWSGTILERPDLDQLRLDAASDLWDGVALFDSDRLSRKYMHLCILTEELEKAGKKVLYVTSKTPENDEDRLMFGVRGVFSEYERYKIAERFRIGKLRKARSGHIIVTQAPYGYKLIKRTDQKQTHLVIDDAEAEVIRLMFHWVGEEGVGIREVIRRLEKKGVKPRKSKTGTWKTSTLNNTFHNESYFGNAYFGKSKAIEPKKPLKIEKYKKIKKTSRVMKPKDEWILTPIPAIISEETYNKARERLHLNALYAPKNKKYEYLLSGTVFCTCDHKRVGEMGRYYRCSDRIYSFPKTATCTERGVDSQLLDFEVWKIIAEQLTRKDLVLKHYNRWVDATFDKNNLSASHIKPLEQELTRLGREESRYVKAYGSGVLSLAMFDNQIRAINTKRVFLEGQLSEKKALLEKSSKTHITEEMVDTYCQLTSQVLGALSFLQKQEIIRTVVQKVIATQSEATIYGYIPFKQVNMPIEDTNRNVSEDLLSGSEVILNVEQRPIHRNRRPSKCRKIHAI